ncbi:MAG: 4Fe-4S binding protein [Endomicrobia bacterium]|nr:4Fe-4S binding protein [Endomicrobiia bacterium]
MKRIYAFESKCLGCGLCEVYCKTAHSKSKDIVKAHKNENIAAGITIEEMPEKKAISYFGLQCRHCKDAECVKACISGAMYKEDGFVKHDIERCVGCLSCMLLCPFGAIKQSDSGQAISKCDLCESQKAPACVSNCPNGALKFLDEKEAAEVI